MKKSRKYVLTLLSVLVVILYVCGSIQTNAIYMVDGSSRGWVNLITLSESSLSMDRGEAYLLCATATVSGDIIWSSSNTSIATVTQYGLVVGVAAGTTYINAEVETDELGITIARCSVTVSADGVIEPAIYFVENVTSGKYMDIEGPSYSNGAYMQIWNLHGGNQCKWNFILGTDGYYRITSCYSSKHVRVKNSSATAGAEIIQNSNIVSGSKWALMKTSANNFALVPASSTVSLVVLNSPGMVNGYNLNTATYTANSDYKDEWQLTRMLPLSGSEIDYGVDDWNSYYNSITGEYEYNNCYAYALNNQIYPNSSEFWDMQQPGEYSGMPISTVSKNAIVTAVSNDFDSYNEDNNTNLLFYEVDRYTAVLVAHIRWHW